MLTTGDVSPTSLVALDFNHDSRVDLAYSAAIGNRLFVLAGTGGGGFAAPFTVDLGLKPAMLVGVAADGGQTVPMDLAAVDQSGNVVIVVGQSRGTLTCCRRSPWESGRDGLASATSRAWAAGYDRDQR